MDGHKMHKDYGFLFRTSSLNLNLWWLGANRYYPFPKTKKRHKQTKTMKKNLPCPMYMLQTPSTEFRNASSVVSILAKRDSPLEEGFSFSWDNSSWRWKGRSSPSSEFCGLWNSKPPCCIHRHILRDSPSVKRGITESMRRPLESKERSLMGLPWIGSAWHPSGLKDPGLNTSMWHCTHFWAI